MYQRTFPKVQNKKDAYRKLQFVWFSYDIMNDSQRKIIKKLVAKNTIANLSIDGKIKYDNMYAFGSFEDYFIYERSKNEISFIHKSDVTYLYEQCKYVLTIGYEKFKTLRN